ncbi:alpha-N-acetylglucosaminidase [Sinosporangium siamense]|uniref:Alpha-N-acetylglucosaminidase n=1 Tax=Sinosporangium siamense TaxID=1367973 RepID=A0A919RMQ0_9ACTN|nr:alpha-N-acetylglucosaminidase [Sinosporangium siamense]GII96398.1 alpha-N-acetylglucosaminidase [Sinosporangium siamense]
MQWIDAARDAVRRLAGPLADTIEVRALDGDQERFEIRPEGGTTVLAGTGPVAVAAALNRYLREVAHGHVSRWGVQLPATAPPPGETIRAASPYRHRVAYNLTVAGYSTAFHQWADWERELDLLAASGVNAAHLTLGQEAVWLEAFQEFGYTERELLEWIVPPSHQAWQWLNNIHSFGGGTSRGLVERRAELARRVLGRMRELGIRPILPGFSGTVPDGFVKRNPGAVTVDQGLWFMNVAGPRRPDWLDTSTPEYAAVAEAFYRRQRERFGRHDAWAIDLLHEGGLIGDASLTEAAAGVERALRAADPGYLWVIQAWAGNPREELLAALDRSRLLVVDLTGTAWREKAGFQGAPWAYGILPNYGGRHGLYGSLPDIAAVPATVRGADGLANMAEGVDTNPVVWDLFADLTWTERPIDLGEWLPGWVRARYGQDDPDALAAWRVLRESVYADWGPDFGPSSSLGAPVPDEEVFKDFQIYASTDSVLAAAPSPAPDQASVVGPRRLHYDPADLEKAWRLLLAAAPRLRDADTYRYDVVDVTRQVLADRARALAADLAGPAAQQAFLDLMDRQERLLATRPEFLLGRWLRAARGWGADEAEADLIERAAKRLITVWGDADAAVLADYANRDWAGLTGDYYKARWSAFFASGPADWNAFGQEWADRRTEYQSEPVGDPVEVALEIMSSQ